MPPNNTMTHRARKRFGQNFLQDHQVIQRIIQAISPQPNDHLIEIGPGLGALTHAICPFLETSNQLDLIELDRDLAENLSPITQKDNVRLFQADALKFDFSTLPLNKQQLSDKQQLRVFGNLPYNISTPLIFHLLKQNSVFSETQKNTCLFKDMIFMLQKEVVERLCATPNNKTYGRLSIMVQYYCHTDMLFLVPPHAFHPQPKVVSAIVRLTPHQQKKVQAKNEQLLDTIVKTAFSQRRKTLRNTLKNLADQDDFIAAGIDSNARAENLEIKDYIKLCNLIDSRQQDD